MKRLKNFLENVFLWRSLEKFLRRPFFFFWRSLEKFLWRPFFFWRALALVSLVLGLGPVHSCPWPRECLSSERLSLALASDFFCVLGLEPCVLDSTSGKQINDCVWKQPLTWLRKHTKNRHELKAGREFRKLNFQKLKKILINQVRFFDYIIISEARKCWRRLQVYISAPLCP